MTLLPYPPNLVNGPVPIHTDTTLTAQTNVEGNGVYNIDAGTTLTISGPLRAGPYQVFGGVGTVQVPNAEYVRPEWWGAKADWNGTTGTDNRVAFDKMLASGCQNFRLMPGNYGFATADSNGNGITVAITGAELVGAGHARTILTFTCPVTWGVKATAALTHMRDFQVRVGSGGSATYAYGVGTTSPGSAEYCRFERIWEQTTGTGVIVNGGAVGPDNPGRSDMDIAQTSFDFCCGFGPHQNAAFLLGNGTAGNVLATFLDNCTAAHGQYGVLAQATGFRFRDGSASSNAAYDFAATGEGSDPIVVGGVRSELSKALWNCGVNDGMMTVSLRDIVFNAIAMTPGGQWVNHNAGGVFKIDNVTCLNSGAVTPYVVLMPSSGTQPIVLAVTIDGLMQANTPTAGILVNRAGASIKAQVNSYTQITGAGVPVQSWTPLTLTSP